MFESLRVILRACEPRKGKLTPQEWMRLWTLAAKLWTGQTLTPAELIELAALIAKLVGE